MKLVIKDKDGRSLFLTEHECCVPVDKIDSMTTAGLQFYLDGKKISPSNLKFQFKDVKPLAISRYNQSDAMTSSSKDVSEDKAISNIDLSNLGFPITSRTVICLNNSTVYRNQKEAADTLNIDPNWVSYSVTSKKSYNGWEFKKVVDIQ